MRFPRPLLLVLLILLLSSLPAVRTYAYPIEPVPLWELVERSDLIVVGDVTSTYELDAPPVDEDGELTTVTIPEHSIAEIDVVDIWKGESRGKLRVKYRSNLLCPAPAYFNEGERVLAFIAESDGELVPVGLSYGTLYPGKKALRLFRDLIREALKLQEATPVSAGDYTDWLVDAAVEPATRWHGLRGLMNEPSSWNIIQADEKPDELEPVILPIHLERLAESFIENPEVDENIEDLLELLEDYPGEELDFAAASAVEGVLAEEELPWWAEDLIDLVLERFGDTDLDSYEEAEERLSERDDVGRSGDEFLRLEWEIARERYAIPEAPPARVRKETDEE